MASSPKVDTDTLRWFVAVADGATVAEAAARAHTTQPAVTRGLQRLAGEIGVPLTERAGRRLQLTFAGEIVAVSSRRILAELDSANRAVAEANDPGSGTVRLGFLSPLGAWLIPELLSAFRTERPDVAFELRHDGVVPTLRALRDGELDLLVSSQPNDPGLRWERLFSEELVLAVPAGHRLAERRQVRVVELSDEPWVLQAEGYGLRRQAEELCAAAGFEPRRALEGHDLTTLYALIGAGSGIGLFSTRPVPPASVRQISLSPRVEREVGIVTRPGAVIPASARAFAEFVRAHAPRLARERSA
jgi:LysR family transcriptional activator of glutamate synthase operon